MTGRQATRTRQKYKDSCTHCAGAKVRCSKEKPRCLRCNERGLECSYGLSYRYGRLPARAKLNAALFVDQTVTTAPATPRELLPNGSRTPSPASEPTAMTMSWLGESSMGMMSASTPAMNGYPHMNYETHASNNYMGPSFDATNTPLTPIPHQGFHDHGPMSDPIASTTATFNAINYIPCLDNMDQPVHRRHHSRSVSSESSMMSGLGYHSGGYQNTSPVPFGTPPETPTVQPVQHYSGSMQHDCLSQAAATLLSLRHEPTSGQIRNRETMEYILQIIDCDCFLHDSYLRMFMVLIGYELMETYSRITRGDVILSNLGDLQVMLKVIERLLGRLREIGAGSYGQGSPSSGQARDSTISYAVFGQLEADLRNTLRNVSHGTIDVFRRYGEIQQK